MPSNVANLSPLATRLRRALTSRDLEAFGALLSDDVSWGDDNHPNKCRSRSDVLATVSRALLTGVDGTLIELASGKKGIFCQYDVSRAPGDLRPGERSLFHVYLVRDDHIFLIQSFDDRASAAKAAGLK
jgi:hypothetical protein